jgi:hypothetical protein
MRIEDDHESWRFVVWLELSCWHFCCSSAVTVGTPFIRGQIQLHFYENYCIAYHIATSSLPTGLSMLKESIQPSLSHTIDHKCYRISPSGFSQKNHDPNLVQYLNNTNPKPRRHASQTLTILKHGRDSNEDREGEKESYHTFETGFSLHVFPSCLSSCSCLVSQLESVNHVRKKEKNVSSLKPEFPAPSAHVFS